MRALVAWRGGLLLTEGEIGVFSVSSLLSKLTWVGLHVGVCVYNAHMVCVHIHTGSLAEPA